MTTLIFRDTPPTTLAGPINAAATTINVASGTGALFPQPTSGQGFYAFMKDAATRTLTEVILVTAVTGDTMTVVRGQGTLSAQPWNAGDFLIHGPCAEMFAAFSQSSGSGGSSGFWQGTDTSTNANIVTVPTTNPSITSPSAGNIFFITKGINGNTGPVTCSIGSGSSIPVLYADGSSLGYQDWPSGIGAWLYYGAGGGGSFEFLGLSDRAAAEIHYGAAGGSADTLSVTVYPPVGQLQSGMLFEIKIGSNNATATPTIAINGNSAAPIINNAGGPLAANDLIAGRIVLMSYDGSNIQLLEAAPSQLSAGVGGIIKGLVIATTSHTQISISATAVTLGSPGGGAIAVNAFSATINTGTAGAGGVDTGGIAGSQSYDLYVGYKPAGGINTAWLTVEGAAPAVPAGVSYYSRVGWMRTDSSSNLLSLRQNGDEWQYLLDGLLSNLPVFIYGGVGNPSSPGWATVSLSGLVPIKSIAFDAVQTALGGGGYNGVWIAPTTGYSAASFTGTAPYDGDPGLGSGSQNLLRQRIYFVSSPTIYCASQGNALAYVSGGKIRL